MQAIKKFIIIYLSFTYFKIKPLQWFKSYDNVIVLGWGSREGLRLDT